MRIKSYFVRTVDDAIAQARVELGEDALLLSTRKTDDGCEVVFGVGQPVSPAVSSVDPRPLADARGSESALITSRDQRERSEPRDPANLESIRAEIDEIRQLLLSPDRSNHRVPELSALFTRLTAAGIDPILTGRIVDGVEAGMAQHALAKLKIALGLGARRFDLQKFEELLERELGKHIRIDASLGTVDSEGTVVALVGPGGAGKTTTIMKIAAFQAAPDRPVRIVTLDQAGLASRMQLQFFARKSSVAFTALDRPETLAAFVENARRKEIVLIDTPSSGQEQLAKILTACPGVDTHMVAPAYMTAPALRHSIAKYSVCRPAKLIVTKLDESPTFGAAVSEAVRAGLSISLFTDGVSIPQNLHAASVCDLVAIALGRDQTQAVCA